MPTYLPATRYGGPIHSVHGLCKALSERGNYVRVVTTSIDGPTDSSVPHGSTVTFDGIDVTYHRGAWPRRLFSGKGMGKLLKNEVRKFDLVHVHSLFLLPTLLACRAAWQMEIPYIVSPRGMLNKRLVHERSRLAKTSWLALFDRKNLERASAVHATSEAERSGMQEFGFDLQQIFVVPNGIDLQALGDHNGRVRRPPGRAYGLYLGRISWKKGIEELIRAWRHVPDLDLVIAGNDEEGLTATLQGLVESLGLGARVHFPGYVTGEEKWSLLQGASLFVLPSRSENFANAVLEAMAVGCPVVLSSDVGLADAVVEHECGIVTETDPSQMGASIATLSTQEDLLKSMGRRAMSLVKEKYAWPVVAENMETAYRRTIAETGHRLVAPLH